MAPGSPLPPPRTGLSPAVQGTSLLQVETGLPASPLSSPALNRINEREHSKHCCERFQNRQPATSSQAAIWDLFPACLPTPHPPPQLRARSSALGIPALPGTQPWDLKDRMKSFRPPGSLLCPRLVPESSLLPHSCSISSWIRFQGPGVGYVGRSCKGSYTELCVSHTLV